MRSLYLYYSIYNTMVHYGHLCSLLQTSVDNPDFANVHQGLRSWDDASEDRWMLVLVQPIVRIISNRSSSSKVRTNPDCHKPESAHTADDVRAHSKSIRSIYTSTA